ncbi:hypothetical protein L1987_45610 [Smallanthus sonchifolius]|uniref:Uncharacterized protein n=1 Tax=Smallanthus sonchifolius TaxID=185202 RepID=A0ACB9FWY1_9ASTR|nr:hypothetical protein L1987_45610 [Smallanthus sonchifolius]
MLHQGIQRPEVVKASMKQAMSLIFLIAYSLTLLLISREDLATCHRKLVTLPLWQFYSEMVIPIGITSNVWRYTRPHWATTYYNGQDISSGGVLEDIPENIASMKTTEACSYCLDILNRWRMIQNDWVSSEKMK